MNWYGLATFIIGMFVVFLIGAITLLIYSDFSFAGLSMIAGAIIYGTSCLMESTCGGIKQDSEKENMSKATT